MRQPHQIVRACERHQPLVEIRIRGTDARESSVPHVGELSGDQYEPESAEEVRLRELGGIGPAHAPRVGQQPGTQQQPRREHTVEGAVAQREQRGHQPDPGKLCGDAEGIVGRDPATGHDRDQHQPQVLRQDPREFGRALPVAQDRCEQSGGYRVRGDGFGTIHRYGVDPSMRAGGTSGRDLPALTVARAGGSCGR